MGIYSKLKALVARNKKIFQNLSYITIFQVFIMLVPLATYPYLVRILGRELYGYVITAQVIASYSSVFVNFGFRSVSARFISIHREDKEKLSDILSSVFFVRCIIWIIAFALYLGIIYLIPKYRAYYLLFVLSYGWSFNELLFPQFFFQGIEKMKYITILNIIIRLVFLVCIFVFIQKPSDYYLVPIFMSLGFVISGIISFIVIKKKEKVTLRKPKMLTVRELVGDSFPIFAKDLITTIKDKLNYILLGSFVNMDSVVVYDLGVKFVRILVKPAKIIGTVMFPVISKSRSIDTFIKGAKGIFLFTLIPTLVVYIFLPGIARFFISDEVNLFPLQLFLSVPVILALSSFISSNYMIAFGKSKYVLYSIIITTVAYGAMLGYFFLQGEMDSIVTFVVVAVFSYYVEFAYRVYIFFKKNKQMKF